MSEGDRGGAGAGMRKVTLVCGPPCSGKSTYVAQHARAGDLVADLDEIARDLGSPVQWNHPPRYVGAARRRMRVLERQAATMTEGRAWVVRSLPGELARIARAVELDASVVLLDPGRDVCEQRAKQRGGSVATTISVIRGWYSSDKTNAPPPIRSHDKRFYKTTQWQRMSAFVLKRDAYICTACRRARATQVDHVRAMLDGGSMLDPANLTALCASCHAAKTARDRVARRLRASGEHAEGVCERCLSGERYDRLTGAHRLF